MNMNIFKSKSAKHADEYKIIILIPLMLWFVWFMSFSFAIYKGNSTFIMHNYFFYLLAILTVIFGTKGLWIALKKEDLIWVMLGVLNLIIVLIQIYHIAMNGSLL